MSHALQNMIDMSARVMPTMKWRSLSNKEGKHYTLWCW